MTHTEGKKEDAIALLQLLNEQYSDNVTMKFSTAKAGTANFDLNRFSIPAHALHKGESYLLYYVIHEFVHCAYKLRHGKEFRKRECDLLSQLGLEIEYNRIYPKTLYANGEKTYTRGK